MESCWCEANRQREEGATCSRLPKQLCETEKLDVSIEICCYTLHIAVSISTITVSYCSALISMRLSSAHLSIPSMATAHTPYPPLVETLGGRSSSPVPHALSFLPSVNSNTPPSLKKSCPIQFFVYDSPSNVAL